ncbi:MAG: acylphosphatase [Candidatus Methanofastidiosia archaeon]
MKRAHLFISGRVQGVFFRSNTRKKALELGLGGWVRNLNDGRVEAVFEGEESAIEKVIDWCHRGPSYASVDDAEVYWEEFRDEFQTFSIRY